jgi:uroporphyrinogen-III synthase
MASTEELSGFTVGITADRRADEQEVMFRRLGVEVMRAPTIRTLPFGSDESLRSLTEGLIADPPDYLVANTALGIRGWLSLAESWGLDDRLRSALKDTRVVARGPKAAAAVHLAGLQVSWSARSEQLGAVADYLTAEGLAGRRLAVQLHGDQRQVLSERCRRVGATVVDLPIYRWTFPETADPVLRLIDGCVAGSVDALTFTAAPAVRNMFALAAQANREGQLLRALNAEVVVGCVGPVCAAAAAELGVKCVVVPDAWRLGALVRAVTEELVHRRHAFSCEAGRLVLQGTVVLVDGVSVRLSDRERALLRRLAANPGATVTRGALLRDVWGDSVADPHVVETTVGRLRAKLGTASAAIETAVRRGYRLSVEVTEAGGPCVEVTEASGPCGDVTGRTGRL